jgi:hypothetical protein
MPRVTDARAHPVPRVGTRSVGKASGSVSHRNEAQRARRFPILTPRLAYEYVRIPVELTCLKPEAARSLFPRLINCNHHFWRLLSQPGLTPPSIATRRRVSCASCASEARLAGAMQPMHHLARGENARCVLLRSHSDSCVLPQPPWRKTSHWRPGKGPAGPIRAAMNSSARRRRGRSRGA